MAGERGRTRLASELLLVIADQLPLSPHWSPGCVSFPARPPLAKRPLISGSLGADLPAASGRAGGYRQRSQPKGKLDAANLRFTFERS